jgi:hypothetical protein
MAEEGPDASASGWLRLLAWADGLALAAVVLVTQGVTGYLVDSLYGPRASYEPFLEMAAFLLLVVPVGTIIGGVVSRCSGPREVLARRLAKLWLIQGAVVIVLIGRAFWVARRVVGT